ncbi:MULTISPECIES: ArsJ-associated glyceraldehyde-3-phosphate dehydrogenase [Halomonadaceae]|jgi:glyceraldehyde 3-phosphate dehydrogenase|uniref:Glyceraldehyde-3-phosphate dehydrogenase n=1 Tax=Vreelandella aquamarina TaxID=77097 RepID=A0A0D7UVM9_9GAMM|nr:MULTISPECIES: ArsJ-associated glyceraldehyde-3-phosphate dehydrogenase [Halomonas]KTG29563.1 glyceraldehyde-3-phosphate dehydrogenase [Idiomarina sp. H105]MEC9021931.1 ArsJ-associated glyceraldehyde-3-phosphate dehydrogenase [Pseudomonadota bacterium]OAF12583.1 glyceraldehyde-3-phosphate dehydrogenase [Idiomarina sp. WRN-38]HBR40846.1 glyceraldehyde-3-phosphate dehydrogenase [Sulfitobacter pontiacus]KJD18601.1 glyceraldehyde-3-phosphate dehydrogenase [Halomonas meridiana]|tara:strand:+ start:58 stop:1089 length:1032 start_codon:yes stop_codon:yes gene_type:complete
MSLRIGINGFGRIGRLALRSLWSQVAAGEVTLVRINDPGGDAATFAHLLEFDSVHGQWAPGQGMAARQDAIVIDGHEVAFSTHKTIAESDWSSCDVVIECSGKMKSTDKLNAYLDQGVGRVVVSAPVKEEGVLNVVVGVNDHLFEPAKHRIVTAASCTTNCLAPVVKVILEHFGIRHGSMTTVHDITNTQTILDAPHKDLRRARACGMSLIPTTTGSAKAITAIFPELEGKLNGHAIRVPLANASLTDMVFELEREVTVDEVNQALKAAADGPLKGILGYEERPLVSIDYRTDPRSSIIDALSTMVVNGTQLKLYAWYDNEWGYANRTAELALMVGGEPVGRG